MYTIHALVEYHCIPVLYALLESKDQSTYLRMWDAITNLEGRLSPSIIMLDFEKAAHNAASEIFTNVTLKGCLFHLAKSLWRKIQETSSVLTRYKERSEGNEVRLFARCLIGLAFLPLDEVETGLKNLQEAPDYPPILDPIYAYFQDTYIGRRIGGKKRGRRPRQKALFEPTVWNVQQQTELDLPRTNNAVEGWHTQFASKVVGVPHPTVFKLIRGFMKEHSNATTNLVLINSGHDLVSTKKKFATRSKRMQRLIQNYTLQSTHGSQDRLTFLKGIAANLSL